MEKPNRFESNQNLLTLWLVQRAPFPETHSCNSFTHYTTTHHFTNNTITYPHHHHWKSSRPSNNNINLPSESHHLSTTGQPSTPYSSSHQYPLSSILTTRGYWCQSQTTNTQSTWSWWSTIWILQISTRVSCPITYPTIQLNPHWFNKHITLFPKKGIIINSLDNIRLISLLNSNYKIYSTIIANRIRTTSNLLVHSDQIGYSPGRNILDIIFTYFLLSTHGDLSKALHLFVDYAKVFDSINH